MLHGVFMMRVRYLGLHSGGANESRAAAPTAPLVPRRDAAAWASAAGLAEGAAQVRRVRASVEVMRGFLLLAWKLKLLSHGGLTALSTCLESISKQGARWEQWFDSKAGE
jgi:hypothetical protein